MDKTIIVALEKGSLCYAYGKNNHVLFTKPGTLYGFTSSTMSVKRGNMVYTYDVNGHQISAKSCK